MPEEYKEPKYPTFVQDEGATLNFENTPLSDANVSMIRSTLKKYHEVQHISVKNANFTMEGIKSLVALLKKYPSVKSLDVIANAAFAEANGNMEWVLANIPSNITHLNLSSNNAPDVLSFAAGLKNNAHLIALDLSNMALSDRHIKVLAGALKENQTLTSLSLKNCGVGTIGFRTLAKALRENHTLIELDLDSNYALHSPDGRQALAEIKTCLDRNKAKALQAEPPAQRVSEAAAASASGHFSPKNQEKALIPNVLEEVATAQSGHQSNVQQSF